MLNKPLINVIKCLHLFDLTHFQRLGQKLKKELFIFWFRREQENFLSKSSDLYIISIFFPASLNHYTPAEDHQTKLERLTGGAITTAAAADSKSNGDKTEIASKLPPSSHLHDALVKEEDENSSDNVEKPPKRRKIKREIIRPDPKYKGKSIKLRTSLSTESR